MHLSGNDRSGNRPHRHPYHIVTMTFAFLSPSNGTFRHSYSWPVFYWSAHQMSNSLQVWYDAFGVSKIQLHKLDIIKKFKTKNLYNTRIYPNWWAILTENRWTPWLFEDWSYTSHIPISPHFSPAATRSLFFVGWTANENILFDVTLATCSVWKFCH